MCVLVKHFANVSALRWNGACVWWVWKCVWWISFSSRKSYRSWETWRHVSVSVCYSFLGVFVTFLVHFVFWSDYYVANFTLLRLLFRLKCTSKLDASTSSRLLIIRNLKVQFQLVCFLLFSFCSVFMCALIDCKFTTLALFRVCLCSWSSDCGEYVEK